MKQFYLTILLFISAYCVLAQKPAYRNYTVNDGLPDTEVYYALQDSKGYMWFATNSGVSRYDGYSFENFTVNDGLTENSILEMYEDCKGRIWFIPYDCKLCYFENDSIQHYKYNNLISDTLGNLAQYRNYSMVVDSMDNLKFMYVYGTCEIDRIGNVSVDEGELFDRRGILLRKDQNMYFRDKKSNYRYIDFDDFYHKTGNRLKDTLYINFPESEYRAYRGQTLSVFDAKGLYVIVTDNLLLCTKDFKKWECKAFEHRIAYVEINDALINVGVLNEGLYRYNTNDELTLQDRMLPDYSVTSLVADHQGGMWITTLEEGVFYSPSRKVLTYTSKTKISNKLRFLVNFNEELWAVTENGFLINPIQDELIHELPDRYITFARNHPETSDLYLGGTYLYKYNQGELQILRNSHSAYDYVKGTLSAKSILFQDDAIWVGSSGYLSKLVNEKVIYSSWADESLVFRTESLCSSPDGGIWMGTPNGLWEYRDSSYCYLGDSFELLSVRIKDLLYSDVDSTLVIASSGSGIILYKDTAISQISVSDGLISNSIHNVVMQDSVLWAASNLGLSEIVFHEGDYTDFSIYSYTINDGLPDNKINDILVKDDTIYVATDKGLAFFVYNEIKRDLASIPTYITNVEVMDKKVEIGQQIKLAHNQDFISISFKGLSFQEQGNIKYRYKLLGLNDQWHTTYATDMKYASLSPGDYAFLVCSQNKAGEWSEPAMFEFFITKPFWNTVVFRVFGVGLVLLVFILIMKFRLQRMEKENQLKEDVVLLRQKALEKQIDPHFIYNSLNSIQSFILKNDNIVAVKYLAKFSKLMRKVLHNSTQSFVSIADEVQALTLYLELERVRFNKKFDFKVEIDPDLVQERTFIPSFFIQPFVENSIWHGLMNSKRNGMVHITLFRESNSISVKILDNGIGVNEASKNKQTKLKGHVSMGMDITRQRLELINKLHDTDYEIGIIDRHDEGKGQRGTLICFRLPFLLDMD